MDGRRTRWTNCTLGDVMTLKRGHDLPVQRRQPGDVPIVSSSGVTGFHTESKAGAPGVVTGRYGTLGEVYFVRRAFWPLNTALYVTDFRGNDPRFVSYFLKNAIRDYGGDKAAVPGVDRNVLHRLNVCVPDRASQERIAELLSSYDDLIENNRRRIVLLEQAARELYREWFVRLHFPGAESTRIVDGVPYGWKRVALEEIGQLRYGRALKAEDRIDGDFPVYGSSGVVGTHDTPHIRGPGIIVGRKGNVGSVYWSHSDFCAIDTVYYVEPSSVTLFLYHTLKNIDFINTDVAVPGLNRILAHSREFLLPTTDAQDAFHKVVQSEHRQMALLRRENIVLECARDLLLPRLMSGKVAV
ncbi:MAG: restriction endonuclease subunit S [Chloroflexota bacterium]|nr:restriction endonuclease subunit S [Chloroflexota bacterium]